MSDERSGDGLALTELRSRLAIGLARMRLGKKALAARAGLGRTTVSEAFSATGPVPSAQTVAALARALKLSVQECLELQRAAAAESGRSKENAAGPGRPINQWEPHDLEVHPAGLGASSPGRDARGVRALPAYVERAHDRVLAGAADDAAAGRSRIVVLVGGSSTGKTRACWEAVQPLADQAWRLWHPFDPTRAEAALEELGRVGPRTVLWPNEAQHYLGDRTSGERIAAAVHHLLVSPERGPVLVLGTLWPEYAAQYTHLPSPAEKDPHSQVRELLSGHTVAVPDAFDPAELAAAVAFAEGGDRLLADALSRALADGRVTQDLAGAPELLNRYQHATPAAKAVLEAAMDARRLGVGLHLPPAFLIEAATGYLADVDYDQLGDDWAERAFAELSAPVHGKQAPLRRTTTRPPRRPPLDAPTVADAPAPTAHPVCQLADYLEQHGRTIRQRLCPPASFWYAAHIHLTHPDDLDRLTQAAEDHHRLQWVHHLRLRAAHQGSGGALYTLAMMREGAGDREGAEALAQRATDHGSVGALRALADVRREAGDREGAESLYRQAADRGNTFAPAYLAMMREKAGDREGAEVLARQSAERGMTHALVRLAEMREKAGNQESAETLARLAADLGDIDGLHRMLQERERAGDWDGAAILYQAAAEYGDTEAMTNLAGLRQEAGDYTGAENLYRQAADRGDINGLILLAEMWDKAGERARAEPLYQQVADQGGIDAMVHLAQHRLFDRLPLRCWQGVQTLYEAAANLGSSKALTTMGMMREKWGELEAAEAFYQRAADEGDTGALVHLAEVRKKAGDRDGAETLYQQVADLGDIAALTSLAAVREQDADRAGAEALYRQAADRGDLDSSVRLIVMREEAGDREDAETLAQLAADRGDITGLIRLATMRQEAGDREGAETLAREVADRGIGDSWARRTEIQPVWEVLWPHGLCPDGTPTAPWQ